LSGFSQYQPSSVPPFRSFFPSSFLSSPPPLFGFAPPVQRALHQSKKSGPGLLQRCFYVRGAKVFAPSNPLFLHEGFFFPPLPGIDLVCLAAILKKPSCVDRSFFFLLSPSFPPSQLVSFDPLSGLSVFACSFHGTYSVLPTRYRIFFLPVGAPFPHPLAPYLFVCAKAAAMAWVRQPLKGTFAFFFFRIPSLSQTFFLPPLLSVQTRG